MKPKTSWMLLLCGVWSAAAQVTVFPEENLVVLPNSNFSFACHLITTTRGTRVTGIEWLLNGTSLESLNLAGVLTDFSDIVGFGFLSFFHVPLEYNNTAIQCVATINPPRSRENSTSPVTTLLVQGTLLAVTSLVLSSHDKAVFTSWEAPFTLDIPDVDPDITYCVDVVSSTSSATLHSECGINVTEFTYILPPRSGCDEYSFTVIPVNVVGNGTSTTQNLTCSTTSISTIPPSQKTAPRSIAPISPSPTIAPNPISLMSPMSTISLPLISSMSTFSPMSTISLPLNAPPMTIISPSQSQTIATEEQQSNGSSANAIVAGTVVAVFIVIIALLGILLVPILVRCRRKTKKISLKDNTPSDMSQPLDNFHEIESTDPLAPNHPQVITYLRPLDSTELKELGTQLGLAHAHINRMAAESLCSSIVHSWLRKDDHVLTTSGEPSWESLANTLDQIGMTGVATNIRNDLLADSQMDS